MSTAMSMASAVAATEGMLPEVKHVKIRRWGTGYELIIKYTDGSRTRKLATSMSGLLYGVEHEFAASLREGDSEAKYPA